MKLVFYNNPPHLDQLFLPLDLAKLVTFISLHRLVEVNFRTKRWGSMRED